MRHGPPLVGSIVLVLLLLAGLFALITNFRAKGFRKGFLGNNWVQAIAMYVVGLGAILGLFIFVVPMFGK